MPKLTDSEFYGGRGPFADMAVGETRTFNFPESGISKTITRTSRPFLFDYHEATNRELEQKGSNYRWLVEATDDGDAFARLVDIRYTKHPSEKVWRPSPEELAQAHAEVDAAIKDGATMQEFKDWLKRRSRG